MAPINLQYREATADDAPAIAALARSAYRGESSRAGWTTEADLLEGERINAAGVTDKIKAPKSILLVAHDESGSLAACCELVHRSDELSYFGLFAVVPTRQGGGIGKQVLATAEAYAKKTWGVKRMEMFVIFSREELIAWYIRRGYKLLDKTEPFPYAQLVTETPLRDDLYFNVLSKEL